MDERRMEAHPRPVPDGRRGSSARAARAVATLILAGLFVPGCATWTTTEKEDLLNDIGKMRRDIRNLKGPTSSGGGIRDQMAELTNRVSTLEGKLAQLGGVDEDLNYRLSQLEGSLSTSRAGGLLPGESPYGYEGPGTVGGVPTGEGAGATGIASSTATRDSFDLAMRAYNDRRFGESVKFLDTFIRENPRSAKLEEAYYYRGEAQFAMAEARRDEKIYEEAILSFDKFRHDYPKSKHLPASLLKQGLAFKALGYPSDAKLFFNDVIRRFPNSSEAAQARRELGVL
jgi:TolA-binding protein